MIQNELVLPPPTRGFDKNTSRENVAPREETYVHSGSYPYCRTMPDVDKKYFNTEGQVLVTQTYIVQAIGICLLRHVTVVGRAIAWKNMITRNGSKTK